MEMSDNIADLAVAMAVAQATIEGAEKDRSNPAFKSKYATLASVWEAWQAVGPKQGLSLVQLPGAMVDGKVTLTTVLLHKSGQWMRETLTIPVTKQDAQGYGSGLTYARRYALAAFAGIAPEDDDGAASVAREPQRPAAVARDWAAWTVDFQGRVAAAPDAAALAKLRTATADDRATLKEADAALYAAATATYKARAATFTEAQKEAA